MGHDERSIFQGVHMLFEGKFDRYWGKKARCNNLVFIGRDLNRDFHHMGLRRVWLEPHFTACWREIMAKSGNRIIVKLKSTQSAYCYSTTKNKRSTPDKLALRKYDPIVRKHVLFRESK